MTDPALPELGSVKDVLHEFLSGASVRTGAPFQEPRHVLQLEAWAARRQFLRAALRPRSSLVRITKGKVWAFSATQNQAESVEPVAAYMNDQGPKRLDHAVILDPFRYWGHQIAWQALRELSGVVDDLSKLDDHALAQVADLPGLLAITRAEAACFRRLAVKNRPGALLITNDHSPRNRAVLAAARALKIPTAYLQHAAVGGIERSLDMDLALLQGQHSLDIYRSIGPIEARVALIGSPKIDRARRRRRDRGGLEKIFVLFPGLFDDPKRVEGVARQLSKAYPNALIHVRPHPRDSRLDWGQMGFTDQALQAQRSAMETLITCDLAIFDDSNAGLEAAALGVPVLCVPFKDEQSDQYALSRTGLFDACKPGESQIVETARGVLSGKLTPDPETLDYLFEDLSSGLCDADAKAAKRLEDLAGL